MLCQQPYAHPPVPPAGVGLIRGVQSLSRAVIPAKAGIYRANSCRYAVEKLDSRLRGNDCVSKSSQAANKTSTRQPLRTALIEGDTPPPSRSRCLAVAASAGGGRDTLASYQQRVLDSDDGLGRVIPPVRQTQHTERSQEVVENKGKCFPHNVQSQEVYENK